LIGKYFFRCLTSSKGASAMRCFSFKPADWCFYP
jgi:hypothetical protein